MLLKIYKFIWVAVALVAAGFYLTGAFTMLTVVAFGFFLFGLIFLGMMCVLPTEVSHPTAEARSVAERHDTDVVSDPAGVFAKLGNMIPRSDGVEIRQPKFR